MTTGTEPRPRVPFTPSPRAPRRKPERVVATSATSPYAPGLALNVDQAWLLARRACHAGTADQAARIAGAGVTTWIDAQLAPKSISDAAVESFIAKTFPWSLMSVPRIRTATGDKPWEAQSQLIRATVWRQLKTTRPLQEKLVELWHDHLHVALFSDKVHGFVCTYDQMIRANAITSFSRLLHASVTHPAMLRYLDNDTSTKAHPNENLAREVLELHTVGVESYTEDDVIALARLLTGFSVDYDSGLSVYRPENHWIGRVTVMGITVENASAASGPTDLAAVLRQLAVHPATVRRVVTKLAVRFVGDNPPSSLIDRLTSTYLANDTAIAPVMRTLLQSQEFRTSTGRRWARPQELLASMHAAARPTYVAPTRKDLWAPLGTYCWKLEMMGHTPLSHSTPDGPPDAGSAWCHPGALLEQWNAASAAAGHWDDTLKSVPWATRFGITTTTTYHQAVDKIVIGLTGYTPSRADRDALAAFFYDHSLNSGVPATTSKIGPDQLKWILPEVVRMVMASPYMALR